MEAASLISGHVNEDNIYNDDYYRDVNSTAPIPIGEIFHWDFNTGSSRGHPLMPCPIVNCVLLPGMKTSATFSSFNGSLALRAGVLLLVLALTLDATADAASYVPPNVFKYHRR